MNTNKEIIHPAETMKIAELAGICSPTILLSFEVISLKGVSLIDSIWLYLRIEKRIEDLNWRLAVLMVVGLVATFVSAFSINRVPLSDPVTRMILETIAFTPIAALIIGAISGCAQMFAHRQTKYDCEEKFRRFRSFVKALAPLCTEASPVLLNEAQIVQTAVELARLVLEKKSQFSFARRNLSYSITDLIAFGMTYQKQEENFHKFWLVVEGSQLAVPQKKAIFEMASKNLGATWKMMV